jgi:hypothetical protein
VTTSRPPTLRITLRIGDEGSRLTLAPAQGSPLALQGRLTREKLSEQRRLLRDDLEKFKKEIGNELPVKSFTRVSAAISLLHERGRLLTYQLFGARQWGAARRLIQRACIGWNRDRPNPLLVEVDADLEDLVPVEFLPLFDMEEPPRIEDCGTLEAVARRFLGFAALVRRRFPRMPVSRNTVLNNVPKLPVKFFHHAGLNGALAELDFFRSNNACVDLEGPWPDQDYQPQQLVHHVASHLWNPGQRFNGAERLPPDQIQHFACHCYTRAQASEKYYLKLARPAGPDRQVTIGMLQARFMHLASQADRQPITGMPLIFFNACGGSAVDPAGIACFPFLFLDNGNRGFIGTETRIPDTLAAAFSRVFYSRLLQGDSLGAAMHAARWAILRRYHNPLGILYTVYADPAMKVRRPVTVQD